MERERKSSLIFLTIIILGLFSGFVRAVFFEKEINSYENRPANRFPALSYADFVSGDFQEKAESALIDQLPLSTYFKAAYNNASSTFLQAMLAALQADETPFPWKLKNGIYYYKGQLVGERYRYAETEDAYEQVTDSYNRAAAENPELEFFYFLVETDAVIDLATGEKNKTFQHLTDLLEVPETQVSRLAIDSFGEYSESFYQTDHHWNNRGSYQGYVQIARMLGVEEEELLVPEREETLPYRYSGTRAMSSGLTTYSETPRAYVFNNPIYQSFCPHEQAFFNGEPESYSYSRFYGADSFELCFDTRRPERENILILGNSMDNAVIELIACHFNRTFSVDLRWFPATEEEPRFSISKYAAEHDVSRILVIGDNSFYLDAQSCVGE